MLAYCKQMQILQHCITQKNEITVMQIMQHCLTQKKNIPSLASVKSLVYFGRAFLSFVF